MDKTKKKKKRQKNKIKIILMLITFIVLIFVLLYFIYSKVFISEIYNVDSRIDNIKEEKKKDNSNYYKTVGWLKVQGTNIDTPIIGYNYDKIEEDGVPGMEASLDNYLWNNVDDEKLYNKVNILGHNILNLSAQPDSGLKYFSRFDDLMSFVYYDFVEDNKYIQYTVDGKDYIYKIFSIDFAYQYELTLYQNSNASKKKMKAYIDDSLKNSLFDFDVKVDENDKIISLITCTRMFGVDDQQEFIVNARLVRENEKLTNYGVKKNSNYQEIEKLLKGDVEDEKA